jgi:hypothetical protein
MIKLVKLGQLVYKLKGGDTHTACDLLLSLFNFCGFVNAVFQYRDY